MSGQYDKIIGELLVSALPGLAGIQGVIPKDAKFEAVRVDFKYTQERVADQVWKVASADETYYLHWEFQSTNDSRMVSRMLLYYALLYHQFTLPVKQVVLYIGSGPLAMAGQLRTVGLQLDYEILDFRTLPYTRLFDNN